MIKLCAKELRTTVPDSKDLKNLKKNPVYIIVDNVLDTYNVGAIFRLADAVAAEKVLLCGVTEHPPHTRIKKASINTTEWVNWEYFEKTTDAIKNLRENVQNIKIIAVEQDSKSVPYDKVEYKLPVALIVSNETNGATREVLDAADVIAEIPMWGVNKSLNVMVSLGIALFNMMGKIKI